jgi:hypothetical protein
MAHQSAADFVGVDIFDILRIYLLFRPRRSKLVLTMELQPHAKRHNKGLVIDPD